VTRIANCVRRRLRERVSRSAAGGNGHVYTATQATHASQKREKNQPMTELAILFDGMMLVYR
jgi:hypothetical protein